MPSKHYPFVGPDSLRHLAGIASERHALQSEAGLRAWVTGSGVRLRRGAQITFTFVLLPPEQLFLADRRSEHISCARGHAVLSAGEMTFLFDGTRLLLDEVTNQSTGYCPEPESWPAVRDALVSLGLKAPDQFTYAFEFRFCSNCRVTSIIKNQIFECPACGGELPHDWNYHT